MLFWFSQDIVIAIVKVLGTGEALELGKKVAIYTEDDNGRTYSGIFMESGF